MTQGNNRISQVVPERTQYNQYTKARGLESDKYPMAMNTQK